jgi:hypothetical protein
LNYDQAKPFLQVFSIEAIMAYTMDWEYDTSEDTSISLLVASGGSGTLYLKNATTGERMSIPYWYVGLGESKGSDLGVAQSTTDMYSAGDAVVSYTGDFYQNKFPCKGFLMSAGAVLDIMGEQNGATSQTFCLYLFGVPVFAGVRCHGKYLSTLPGIGVSCAVVNYGYATVTGP